ncbi:MAG: hypothetical protein AUJ47_06210 [Candidatus Marinimicrobia bacterium CG1_02_48_14]|nr:MAG: hypothetical protein AUJ47_06210 [Candidatus Marinimicrobia bacterium CG1_02_48_14]
MIHNWYELVLMLGVGIAAGFFNILAGGGSFLTLPLLIFLGLPPNIANGTNRLAILMQNVIAVGRFKQLNYHPGHFSFIAGSFTLPGAILGTWLATQVSNTQFKTSLAIIMLVMTIFTLVMTNREKSDTITPDEYTGGWRVAGPVYFLIGIYGGYIQAGIGFLIIAVILWQGLNLVHGNAVKLTIITLFTAVSLIIFAFNNQVNWVAGLLLGVGNIMGGLLGAQVSVKKGHAFIKKTISIAVIIFAVKLLLD